MLCKTCGSIQAQDAQFCTHCGAEIAKPQEESQAVADSENPFVARLHQYGSNQLFLAGCILYTFGAVVSQILTFSFFNFIVLGLGALPIIGVWVVYNACNKPKVPEATLTAMTLFRVRTIIALVGIGIFTAGAGLGVAGTGIAILFTSGATRLGVVIAFVASVFALVILILIIRFYFVALLQVIKSIKEGIQTGYVREIRGAGSFVVLSYIGLGIGIASSLFFLAFGGFLNLFVTEVIYELTFYMGSEVEELAYLLNDISFGRLTYLISLASSVGQIFLITMLSRFANSFRQDPLPRA